MGMCLLCANVHHYNSIRKIYTLANHFHNIGAACNGCWVAHIRRSPLQIMWFFPFFLMANMKYWDYFTLHTAREKEESGCEYGFRRLWQMKYFNYFTYPCPYRPSMWMLFLGIIKWLSVWIYPSISIDYVVHMPSDSYSPWRKRERFKIRNLNF